MAGEGFARDAQKSQERNRGLLSKTGFERMKSNTFINAPKVSYKEASPEELAALKKEYEAKSKNEKRFQIIVYSISFFLFAAILFWILV